MNKYSQTNTYFEDKNRFGLIIKNGKSLTAKGIKPECKFQQVFKSTWLFGACYRVGRVGKDFMDKAKPGLIKLFCQSNALLTLKEYLLDYADDDTRVLGNRLIEAELAKLQSNAVPRTEVCIDKIAKGERDIYI